MLIIPAIDISLGQAVRLQRGDMNRKTIYGDPVEFALRWQEAGAGLIHVVDLDGAIAGKPVNLATVRRIAEAVTSQIELGGGLREPDDVRQAVDAGVTYAVMGTSALRNRASLEACIQQFGERVIVGIDARDGMVAVGGWLEDSGAPALGLAEHVQAMGVRRVIFTDIATDGMLQGPNLDATAALARAVTMEVIASGGVTTLEDLRAIAALEPLGVIGAIVGRAIYEGAIDLAQAICAVGRGPDEVSRC